MIKKTLGVSLSALVLATGAGIFAAGPAMAAPALYLPFPAGTQYTVGQYPHTLSDPFQGYAMDIPMPRNAPVSASAPGTVRVAGLSNAAPSYNGRQVIVDHGGDFCTQYNHLESVTVSVGQQVAQGQKVGGAGDSGLAYGTHLHFNTITCSTLKTRGPLSTVEYPGGFSSGMTILSANKPPAQTPITVDAPRLLMSDSAGNVSMKEGSLTAGWTLIANAARSFSSSGTRVGVVTSAGVATIKDGPANAAWVDIADQAKSIVVTGNRIGILRNNGELWVKEGAVNAQWVVVASMVTDFSMDGNRIGVITQGKAEVKEGPLGAPWVTEVTGSSRIQVSGNRIAVLQSDGSLLVKEGDLYAGWVTEATGVSQFHLAGSRIAAVSGGVVSVKEGSLYAPWSDQTTGALEVKVTQNRLAVVGTNGKLFAKDGSLGSTWVELATDARSVSLTN